MESHDGDGLKPVKTVVKAASLLEPLLLPRAPWAELFTLRTACPATVPSCSQPEAQAVGHPHCSPLVSRPSVHGHLTPAARTPFPGKTSVPGRRLVPAGPGGVS